MCVHSLGFGPRVNRLGSGLLTSSLPGLPGIFVSESSYREIHALASAKRQQRWHHAECTSSLQRATCDRRRATRPGQHTTYNGRQHGRCTRHGRRANLQRPTTPCTMRQRSTHSATVSGGRHSQRLFCWSATAYSQGTQGLSGAEGRIEPLFQPTMNSGNSHENCASAHDRHKCRPILCQLVLMNGG